MSETIQPIDTETIQAPYITIKKAAELTGLPSRILRLNIADKKKIGGNYYVRVTDVNDFVRI